MFANLLPRLGTLVQPQVIAAGVLTGIVGGVAGVASGAIPVTDAAPRNQVLYECPDGGRIVTSVQPDQKVLVVARSADGAWLEIYLGTPGAEHGWAPASALNLAAAPDSLPIDDCTPSTPGPSLPPATTAPGASDQPSPSTEPTPTPSAAPSASPSPSPKPTATPKPTPTPLTGPVLSDVLLYAPAQEGDGVYRVYFRDYYTCPYAWDNVGLTVAAADPEGIASVTLYYQPTGGVTGSVAMDDEDGYGTLWDGGFNAEADWAAGPLQVWMQATDGDGNPGPILDLATAGYELAVGICPGESPT